MYQTLQTLQMHHSRPRHPVHPMHQAHQVYHSSLKSPIYHSRHRSLKQHQNPSTQRQSPYQPMPLLLLPMHRPGLLLWQILHAHQFLLVYLTRHRSTQIKAPSLLYCQRQPSSITPLTHSSTTSTSQGKSSRVPEDLVLAVSSQPSLLLPHLSRAFLAISGPAPL